MAKKIDYASMYTLRKDGRYMGRYSDSTGRHCVYDKDPEKLYHKIQALIEKEATPPTFSEIAESYENSSDYESLSEGTKACYAAHLTRARDRFDTELATEITPNGIDTLLKIMKSQGYSASSISKQRTVFRLIYHHAIVHPVFGRFVKDDPSEHIKLPKGLPKPNKREAPEDEIINAIQDRAGEVYFGTFALFLISTGFRRGEALAVQWKDIDFERGMISCTKSVSLRTYRGLITEPKTENGIREVPILAPLEPYLQMPPGAQPTDFVFHGEDPSLPMPKSAYDRKWKHYCKDMGFVEDSPEVRISSQGKHYVVHNYKNTLTAHVLRHGYATLLYEAEIDEKEAVTFMGHADEDMIRNVYSHLRNKKRASAADRLRNYTRNSLTGPNGV